MSLHGDVRVVKDVAGAYAAIVAEALAATITTPLLLGTSGSSSGAACAAALGARSDIELGQIALYYIDERCVPDDSPDRNANTIKAALGDRYGEFAAVYEMSCAEGPKPYADLLASAGRFDILQLGLGPDGHTASIFPDSAALSVTDVLVARNTDPHGLNVHERLTWTYAAINAASLAVFTVIGAEKVDALAALSAGADLPAGRVRAGEVIWLLDEAAAKGLER